MSTAEQTSEPSEAPTSDEHTTVPQMESSPPADLVSDRLTFESDRRARGGARARRRWIWIGTFAALLGMLGLGWYLGSTSQSPAQAAAKAEAPVASWITVPVEKKVLTATVIQRGDVTPEESVSIGVPASVEGDPVVTQVDVAAGDEVAEGTKVVEISGRPVFVMLGAVPVYRSLKPSMEGADVRQLQEALVRVGYPVDVDGVYGAQTKEAVKEFYKSSGYEPVPASETAEVDLTAAEQGASEAKRSLASAEANLAAAKAGATQVDTEGNSNLVVDAKAVAEAQRAVDGAKEQVETTQKTLDAARSASGPMVPQGEIVFLSAFPARVMTAQTTVGPIGGAADSAAVAGGASNTDRKAAVELAVGRLVVKTSINPADVGLLRNGMIVQLLDESTSNEYPAEITELAVDPVAGTDGQLGYPAVLVPQEPLPDPLNGTNVRVTATTASTDTEVLVVPVAAVSSTADGSTQVTVVIDPNDPEPVEVTVRAGLSADGFIAVEPIEPDALDVGSLVVVGR